MVLLGFGLVSLWVIRVLIVWVVVLLIVFLCGVGLLLVSNFILMVCWCSSLV